MASLQEQRRPFPELADCHFGPFGQCYVLMSDSFDFGLCSLKIHKGGVFFLCGTCGLLHEYASGHISLPGGHLQPEVQDTQYAV